ncbi:MAG TPA: hypothetical protein VMI54_19880 [Polyangiaceae bacterium]|nr:hypothetical protein [Polyangiaceae bacterium]
MSEPAQLVVRVPVSESGYRAFRQAAPPEPSAELGWDAWLGSQRYYGPPITFERLRNELCRYEEPSIDACLRAWARADDSGRARDRYDATRGEWRYLLVDFSENYGDYARVLNVLQHLARFKDGSEPGYALVFNHVWEQGAISALVRIDAGRARFVEHDTDEARAFARDAADAVERATGFWGFLGR